MTSGGIFCIPRKSRAQRFYLKGSVFFLLLHMLNATPTTETAIVTNSSGNTSTPAATSSTLSYMTSANTDNTSGITNTSALPDKMSTDLWNSSSGNVTLLSCPAFTCTTDCYARFMNETATPCPWASLYCELIKQPVSYSINCSVSCGTSCGNGNLSNCSLACCNTTSCLNNSLLAISSLSSTTAPTKPSTTAIPTKGTVPPTPANNGKKCHSIKCNGAACYKGTSSVMLCPVDQNYCMLSKVMVGTVESWQGGCSGDCRKAQACSSGLTTCYLECCNATTAASCLKLTGDLNMPSSASRGPQAPVLLTAYLLLLWMVKILT